MTRSVSVSIQTQDFDLGTEVARLRANDKRVGAVCAFVGTVREYSSGAQLAAAVATTGHVDPHGAEGVSAMELEHYPGMTERVIEGLIEQAQARFDITGARVIHRVGRLLALDQIVLVAVTSAHRGQSFAACEFLMDKLKTEAPFWKKEFTPQGPRWVDARQSDEAARARWDADLTNSDGAS